MKSWTRFRFTIRTLLIFTVIAALAIWYFQTRTEYVLRVPNGNVFYGLLERGDTIAIMTKDGERWRRIRRSVLIESQITDDRDTRLTVSVTSLEWREI